MAHGAGEADYSSPIAENSIREELNRVLAGHEFRSSKRSQEFLRYVVENTLTGHADILKERTIGIEVFGRSTSYDPSDDATVRVKAGEVRKRLGLYYAGEGVRNPIRIELPAGTYVPEFHRGAPVVERNGATASTVGTIATDDGVVIPLDGRRKLWIVVVLFAAVAAGTAAFFWTRGKTTQTALDQFWSP